MVNFVTFQLNRESNEKEQESWKEGRHLKNVGRALVEVAQMMHCCWGWLSVVSGKKRKEDK